LALYPMYLAIKRPGELYTRQVTAVCQVLFSALLIHITGGRIETHFHVFGSLAFLAFYRDWKVLVSASAVVAADHLIRGFWFPFSAYGVQTGAEWRFLEHAGWVVFEDVFLMIACATGIKEMRSMARRQAELQIASRNLEEAGANIRRQSAVLNSVLNGMGEGLVVADLNGKFLHFNPAAAETLGAGAKDIAAKTWPEAYGIYREDDELFPPEELPLARAIRGEAVDGVEFRIKNDAGDQKWLEANARPLHDENNELSGGVVVFRDVTERRHMTEESSRARQEAERANRAKSEFLSRMSHELRTPMNSILGFGQLLEMEDLDADALDSVKQITKAGRHLLKLINEILDISRIEAGRLATSIEPVEVGAVAREVLALVKPLAAQRNIEVIADLGAAECFVHADRQRLSQVLLNLLSNAIKYNRDAGFVWLSITSDGSTARISVRDTGPGIAPENHELIFKPFERLGADQSDVEGTGLGLALSQRLAESMGGRIGIEASSEGASFFVELGVTEALHLSSEEEPAPAEFCLASSRTILLVEDNPANVKLMEKMLANRPGCKLMVTMQGRMALELARQHKPDLVLLDLNLPDLNGDQVMEQLRSDPTTSHIPVVIVSADATSSQVSRLLEAGANAYISKPIDVNNFLALLNQLLSEEVRNVA